MKDDRQLKAKILDIEYDINISSGAKTNNTNCGTTYPAQSRIWVNSDRKPDTMASTLLHEIIHTIAIVQGVDLSEQDTRNLETGLFSFMRNNTRLAISIAEGNV